VTGIGYAFTGMAELLRDLLRLELIGAVAGAACWGACCAVRSAWTAGAAWHRHARAEAALRAEADRGLAAIESYLRARSASALPSDPDTQGQDGNAA
jgi:hypothetical protein